MFDLMYLFTKKSGKDHFLAYSFPMTISGPRIGPSQVYINGVSSLIYIQQPESRRSKFFIGGSLGSSHFIARNLNLKIGFLSQKIAIIGRPLELSKKKFTNYWSFSEGYFWIFIEKKRFFLGKFSFEGVLTWSHFGGCSGDLAPLKKSNTPDLFYPRMDLSIPIIKLR